MTSAPALVILRGNSASGKSTIARKVQHHLPQGRIAVIGQDSVRREVLWEEDVDPVATIALTEVMVHHCLSRGRTVILEGIFKVARYEQMFQRLLAAHDGPALVYYLDVSLTETLRRHALKPIAGIVSDDEVASWYVQRDTLGLPTEALCSLNAWARTRSCHASSLISPRSANGWKLTPRRTTRTAS